MLIIRLEKTDKYFTLLFQDISVIFSFVTHAARWSLLRPRERWRSIVIRTSICLSVCLYASISPKPYARSLPNSLCMLPMAVARSFSGRVTKCQREGTILGVSSPLTMHCNAFAAKGIIQYRPGRSDRSAQRGRSVIYDCLVVTVF